MSNAIQRLQAGINSFLWDVDLRSIRGVRKFVIEFLRLLYVFLRELMEGRLSLWAMSLVYTTLLSLVPLLAVSFSVLKAFGVHNQLEPLLLNFLEPLGPRAEEVTGNIIGFVENIQVGVLGAVGLGVLVWTAISLLQKIEGAFNFVWHIDSLRSFGQRFAKYLSVILIGPVLVFSAVGMTATVMNTAFVQRLVAIEPFGTLMLFGTKLIPYLLVWIAFTFIYTFVPNTPVRFGAAALGGVVAGIIWQTTGWGFTAFIAGSTRYTAIYSSFAIVILLLIWLYLNWLILLVGAQIAFYVQNPQYLTMERVSLTLSNRLRERVALTLMYLIGFNHHNHTPAWNLEGLVERLGLPAGPLHGMLEMLRGQGYVEPTAEVPTGFLPARDIDTIEIRALLQSIRRAEESRFLREDRMPFVGPVDDLLGKVKGSVDETLGNASLKDLVLAGESRHETQGDDE